MSTIGQFIWQVAFFLLTFIEWVRSQPSTVFEGSFDGSFLPIPSDWETEAGSLASIIRTPTVDFINDTAVGIVWVLDTSNNKLNIPTSYQLEISFDIFSDDFINFQDLPVIIPSDFRNSTFTTTHIIDGLSPESDYRFRVCPFFITGRGHCSFPVVVTTLGISQNYWEPVIPRRLSLGQTNRGFNYPVVQRPHLDTGVEVFGDKISDNAVRWADAPTEQTPVLPSGRRGHSLSLVDGYVFMVGGRTNGYTCSNVYKDTLNIGNIESGREVYPCTSKQSEVNEVWSLDIGTYQWVFLNTSKWQMDPMFPDLAPAAPPPREQHAAAVLDRDVYIFGGKSRLFESDPDSGEIFFTHHSDTVYGDLWKLSVERAQQYVLRYTSHNASEEGIDENINNNKSVARIPQGSQKLRAVMDGNLNATIASQSDGVTPREGQCVEKMIVRITIEHPCIKQLRASLLGPGPLSGSPNYFPSAAEHEVLLFNQLSTTNGTTDCGGGVHYFEFDDDATRSPETCCQNTYDGTYQPQGRLAEFIDSTMSAEWTLVVQDINNDDISGSLLSWEIEFTSLPCFRSFEWTNISAVNAPENRYASLSVAYKDSLFIYGGRDERDFPLHDLHRFDINTQEWVQLSPVQFDNIAWDPSSSEGGSFVFSAWGLLRYGGYYRQPFMPQDRNNYDSSVGVQDLITMRWSAVEALPAPYRDTTVTQGVPPRRYLAASVLIPASHLTWKTKYTHRNLYDEPLPSMRSNIQGGISDSLLVIGGFDGSTGSVYDGSSGGYFSDMWMLRLSNWSTPGVRHQQQQYIERMCRWRTGETAVGGGSASAGTESCLGPQGSECELRSMLLLPWCQSTTLLPGL